MKYYLLATLLLVGCGRGPKGSPGQPGPAGRQGSSCHTNDSGLLTCPDGSTYQIPAGAPGKDGAAGSTGPAGADSDCSATAQTGGVLIKCSNGTEAVLLNGAAGAAGAAGATGAAAPVSAYAVTQVISPCPTAAVPYHEVLLRLQNGQLLAHYDDGNRQFLTLVPAGAYELTDGSHCAVTVASDGSVTW